MSRVDIQILEFAGLRGALEALHLPFGKKCNSECVASIHRVGASSVCTATSVSAYDQDLALLKRLVLAGDEHAKVMRGVMVWLAIEAPIWLLRELETYRAGRERLASESTMHIECKGLSGEELQAAKDAIPMGHRQRTVDVYSYQALRRIYLQRRHHRLPAWRDFCTFIEHLPLAAELITCERTENNTKA